MISSEGSAINCEGHVDLTKLKFDEQGLIPAIVQDAENGEVLMMAYMNGEALRKTLETGFSHFYSRSRRRLWKKGEESGHVQRVREVLYDCDQDTLLLKVEQEVAACHTGHRSCFFEQLHPVPGVALEKAFEPQEAAEGLRILDRLYQVILSRRTSPPADSYVAKLLAQGQEKIFKKLAEELTELILASKDGRREAIVYEAADLLFHFLVLLGYHEIRPEEVGRELERRFGKKPDEYRGSSGGA